MQTLGINIGSSNVKLALVQDGTVQWNAVAAHEGNFIETLQRLLESYPLPQGVQALVTGTDGRYRLRLNNVIEPLTVETAVRALKLPVSAVVSMGGEDLVVYTLGDDGRIVSSFSGNKCASGTGEFFKQQLGRMDLGLEHVNGIPTDSRVLKLSSRCSVFMKSDSTHKLNKGEATKGDIVLSLSNVMATKVVDFLSRARLASGRVLLAGGVTHNQHLVHFLRSRLPEIEFVIPDQAPWLEAYGAALLAAEAGSPLPPLTELFRDNAVQFERFENLRTAEKRVTFIPSRRTQVRAGRSYILGVDGGSTTTKACLIDMETHEIAADYYGRTHGDPVRALKGCVIELIKQVKAAIGDAPIRIPLAATTGSSREILGVFLETPAVYNEIIAHAVGTTFFQPQIDTLFEIGGQDAKYVYLKNKVPIDYAMNEACSAGTGSFLEESCHGDLNIPEASQIGDIALAAERPLKFGEHCSAFINSDIRKAVQQGASREDITAGIVTSIVANYLNRVVGNRTIGNHIVLQGGVAKNRAVPIAFAMLLDKDIVVPPDPELMGCFGVGLLAAQRLADGLLEAREFDLETILQSEIKYEREFTCRSCDNFCPIRVLNVSGRKYSFGGRCNKYANMRKKKVIDEDQTIDWVARRNALMFEECVPAPGTLRRRRAAIVGVPRAFSIYSLWPFYAWYFHSLGIETRFSDEIRQEGVAKVESAYCFPAEIAHGAVDSCLSQGVDYLFLPHFRDLESMEKDVHACFCPITQGLPYYLKKAFPDFPADKVLDPVVSFKYGKEKGLEPFIALGLRLGFSREEALEAAELAWQKQRDYEDKAAELGRQALAHARASQKPVIALLGRPYNAFTADANMGIPRKFSSRGCSVIPFDILPLKDQAIFQNQYWYYGQQDMKATSLLQGEQNIYITYVTNFSCAPDSFLLHYVKWMMGTRPFLILELDSHSADAGVDTRVEAFLDIIEGYRARIKDVEGERYDNGLRFINNGQDPLHVLDTRSGQKFPVHGSKKIKFLLSNMGRLSTELCAASMRSLDIQAEAMPMADLSTVQVARAHSSGKECLPSHLVLGSTLQYLASEKYRKDTIYLIFVPTTRGPCRTGQYSVFYENLFRDLRLENVLVVTMDSSNSYTELGANFSRYTWWALVVGDYMKDLETSLRTCAADPQAAMAKYDTLWRELVRVAEVDVRKCLSTLKHIASEVKKIPLKRKVADCPRVLIVGEIYVRRDDFAVDELINHFSSRGILGKVSGVTEWIYYCDFVRKYDLKKRLGLRKRREWLASPEVKGLVRWKAEELYKHSVEMRVRQALKDTNLLIDFPHDMEEIMTNTEQNFVSMELNSEIAISSGVASTAMLEGYSGIVNISPFSCLIGRVIEGLVTPWARERGFPMLSVEIDGNLLPPGIVNKLEIFMLNVLRYGEKPALDSMVDRIDAPRAEVSRRMR